MTLAPATDRLGLEELLPRIRATECYLLRQGFRGYDPYDALASPLLRLPGLRRARPMRFAAQQVLKRLPVNIRPLLGIRKGLNPVTVALAAQAFANLTEAEPDRADDHRRNALRCVGLLAELRSPGYSGDCWGYDFDWEARHACFPAGTPTVVATGFVTNALFAVHELVGSEEALELCVSAAGFVRRDLRRREDPDGSFCWSYGPADDEAVLNATMKGARLCAQVSSVTGDAELRDLALRTTRFVVARQRHDGSWPYSAADSRTWADNFHTAYILDALDEVELRTGDATFSEAKERGWRRYRECFFADGFIPKYYDNRLHPVDATACAQSIVTLCRFGDVDTASRTAAWALERLGRGDGAFAYQLHRRYENRVVYVRWSVAWMFCALAVLAHRLAGGS